jgi:hypothetical protein
MTRSQHLRRVAILCCHCLGNLAFYKAGWLNGKSKLKSQFWLRVNGNFLDIAVLEWCKLFADTRGKHYWRKAISDDATFQKVLLAELKLSTTEFEDYVNQMRTYRDKFIAHLDSEEVMHIPLLQTAVNSTVFLYDYLLDNEETDGCFADAQKGGLKFYEKFLVEGTGVYEKNTQAGRAVNPG